VAQKLNIEYKRWWKNLTNEERRKLIASGAFNPSNIADSDAALVRGVMDDTPINMHAIGDNKNTPHWLQRILKTENNVVTNDVAANMDSTPNLANDMHMQLIAVRWRATIHFLLEGLDNSTDVNARLRGDIIRLVMGEGDPPSMTQLGKQYGLSRAAISHRCRTLLRRLGLEPSKYMETERTVHRYRVRQLMVNINKADCPPAGKKSTRK
jgi:hypothetical protein